MELPFCRVSRSRPDTTRHHQARSKNTKPGNASLAVYTHTNKHSPCPRGFTHFSARKQSPQARRDKRGGCRQASGSPADSALSGKMGKGYKVVVCGMASVGKTAILEQLLYGKHTVGLEEGATMEDVYLASVETDRGVKEQLRLYDTRGLQEGVELPKHYFSVADGFVLVYAVTSLEAFQRVELLKKEIDVFRDKKEVTVIVLGNKTDLLDQRQVETETAQQWARAEKVRLWEVTVTDRKTLLEPFTFLASKLSQSQNKSAFPLPGRKSKGNNCDN
ncbi:NF-kappa-B inhibitor-interacting Ras-like protein 1 isoform X1 [Aptenodytes patagonicus]|uniref:NF-kappa-B inhibitor-interacting Ras-like protein 1 isoform X1 n=1 Tax=Aptenodytes patagonicus TaxID=9234 RepID=UPI003FA13EDD